MESNSINKETSFTVSMSSRNSNIDKTQNSKMIYTSDKAIKYNLRLCLENIYENEEI